MREELWGDDSDSQEESHIVDNSKQTLISNNNMRINKSTQDSQHTLIDVEINTNI